MAVGPRIRVWDALVRVLHWTLAGAVATCWISGHWPPSHFGDWHHTAGYVAGAAVDVWSEEPPESDTLKRLIQHPRVVVTPHLGANSSEAQVNVAVDVARQLVAFRDGAGQVAVLDAQCPHFGAHRGVGGEVVEGCLRCPFHGLHFDRTGQCVKGDYVRESASLAHVRSTPWTVHETAASIFVWHGAHRDRPDRPLAGLPLRGAGCPGQGQPRHLLAPR